MYTIYFKVFWVSILSSMCKNWWFNSIFIPDTAQVRVKIGDVNDNRPFFEQQLYTANIREDAFISDIITTVEAKDLDGMNTVPENVKTDKWNCFNYWYCNHIFWFLNNF